MSGLRRGGWVLLRWGVVVQLHRRATVPGCASILFQAVMERDCLWSLICSLVGPAVAGHVHQGHRGQRFSKLRAHPSRLAYRWKLVPKLSGQDGRQGAYLEQPVFLEDSGFASL